MSQPAPQTEVTHWVNLYRMQRSATIYAESFVSKQLADEQHEHCHLTFNRSRLGNKAHKVVYWEGADGV